MSEPASTREPILPTPSTVIETDTLKGTVQKAFEKINPPVADKPETRRPAPMKPSQVIDVDVERAKATVGKYFGGENPVPIKDSRDSQ